MSLSKLGLPKLDIPAIATADEVAENLFCLHATAHKEHLNAVLSKSYARHNALGAYYDAVEELKDRIIEHMIGSDYLASVKLGPIDTAEDVLEEAEESIRLTLQFAKMQGDDAMINMGADLQEATAKLKYMLKFA